MRDRSIQWGGHWPREVRCDGGIRGLRRSLVVGLLIVCAGCHQPPKEITDEDAESLTALAPYNPSHTLDAEGRVIELRLEGKQVDDRTLDAVKKLSQLRALSLYGASVTDAGLVKLSGLVQLEKLGLGATRLTDRGLKHLWKMPSLRYVWLTENSNITERGVQTLRERALPGLTVYH